MTPLIARLKYAEGRPVRVTGNKKDLGLKQGLFILLIRRLLTFPGLRGPSNISHGGLYFRVRNGNGCDPSGIATGILIRRAEG